MSATPGATSPWRPQLVLSDSASLTSEDDREDRRVAIELPWIHGPPAPALAEGPATGAGRDIDQPTGPTTAKTRATTRSTNAIAGTSDSVPLLPRHFHSVQPK